MDTVFIFLLLILFPFGQIIRIGVLQPIDFIAGCGAFWAIIQNYPKPKVFRYLKNILFVAGFSWIFSVFIFKNFQVFYGLLYLIRLFSYVYFFVYAWNFVKRKTSNRQLLLNSLLLMSVFSALFGWIQFYLIPDTRALYFLGWDDHFLRLIGTFLDPTFLGLIIVFGLLIASQRLIESKNKWYFLILFLSVSLAFTYSRASYLAFATGLFVIMSHYKKMKIFFICMIGFLIIMLFLPTAQNRILSFMRAFSVVNRLENYSQTIEIFKTTPVFGVGYNNLCLARANVWKSTNVASHSCSGSDSSLLFILATTGLVGFMIFVYSLKRIHDSLLYDSRFIILSSCFAALIIHSIFSNSMFYPWIMGYTLILLAICLRE